MAMKLCKGAGSPQPATENYDKCASGRTVDEYVRLVRVYAVGCALYERAVQHESDRSVGSEAQRQSYLIASFIQTLLHMAVLKKWPTARIV
jgi:hypothetical protein